MFVKITTKYASYSLVTNSCPLEFDTSYGNDQRFIFKIINSLIESCGVRLTCLDCKVSEKPGNHNKTGKGGNEG